jgi:hypothetical protein
MKLFEGKTAGERNKIIAAIILGGVAVLALAYTLSGFFYTPKPSGPTVAKVSPTPASKVTGPIAQIESTDNAAWLTTPIVYYPNAYSGDAGRNIFSFYEPPAPTPWQPTPVPVIPVKPPTPEPPLPFELTYVNPASIYAGSKAFRLEVMGDRFTTDAKILFNGSELPTNFISPQKLTADVPNVLIAESGSRQVMVRTPDGKSYSKPVMLTVQAPPVPTFEYVGLVEKKHRNNDMAILREKGKTDMFSFRLNDPVGDRFKVVSISVKEVVLEDRSLGFKHRLPFSEGKSTGGGTVNSGFGNSPLIPGGGPPGRGMPGYMPNGFPNPGNPVQPGEIPGIPGNIPRAPVPANNSVRNPTQKRDYEDDNDDGPR